MAWNWDLRAVSGPPRLPGLTNLTPLGAGGMGQVYRGEDATGRAVAVKVLRRVDEAALARFQREAELLARFRAPEIVTAHSWGVTDECSYLVCALVEGVTLEVAAEGLDLPARAELFLEVVRAVGVAHALGVVHRDLKPANVLVTPEGAVRLIDFGISIGLDQERLTQTGQLVGTPAYMPLERLAKATAPDPRSDVWSLGVVGYELFTERQPYPTHSILDFAHRNDPPPPLEAEVSPALERVVLRALSPAPGDRYATAGDMADALERALSGAEGGTRSAKALTLGVLALGALAALVAAGASLTSHASSSPLPSPSAGPLASADAKPQDTPTPATTPATSPGASPTESPTDAPSASPSPSPSASPELVELPVVFSERFARNQLSDRWEASGDVRASIFEEQGAICLRITSSGEGLVNTRRDAVVLPDMNAVEEIAVRVRSPEGKAPSAVRVLLGNGRRAFSLRGTVYPTSAWKTYRLPLRWLRPHVRAHPRVEELKQVSLLLEGPGVLEVQGFELLGGKRGLTAARLSVFAYPDQAVSIAHFGDLVGLLVPTESRAEVQELLKTRVLLGLTRLRDSLGTLAASRGIVLLLFPDRARFTNFWRRLGQRLGTKIEIGSGVTTASYMHIATAIHSPDAAGHFDCVSITARAFLSRSLRLLSESDWLFHGVGELAWIEARKVGLSAYLAEVPRQRVPLRQIVSQPPREQVWQAVLLVRWLQNDPRAPVGFEELLRGFRAAGNTNLEHQLKAKGTTLEEVDALWWAWVRATFPDFKLAK